MKTKLVLFSAISFILGSCNEYKVDEVQKHIIVKKFKVTPVSIHDEISPRYRAVLENGDTVAAGENSRVGDTIEFIYYKVKWSWKKHVLVNICVFIWFSMRPAAMRVLYFIWILAAPDSCNT